MSQLNKYADFNQSYATVPEVQETPYLMKFVGFVPPKEIRELDRKARNEDGEHVLRAVACLE